MKITKVETTRRTIRMMANFLHRPARDINLEDDLRKKWRMSERDFGILEIWIEGPISADLKGYFQDVKADVRVADLRNPKVVSTIDNLVELIWASIP